MTGSISILSVYEGDVKINFDTSDLGEAIRAKRIILDMLRRGYALLIKLPDGSYTRALGFDEAVGEYIIADFDPAQATQERSHESESEEEAATAPQTETETEEEEPKPKPKRGRRRLKMERTHAVGIARSAGG